MRPRAEPVSGGRLVLVVPCYNEARRLRASEFLDFLERDPSARILFVNDGSTDSTGLVLERLAIASHGVQVLELHENAGKGEAVRRGMVAALATGAEYVGYWDADLSTPLAAVAEFRSVFAGEPRLEAVIGSRVRMLGRHIVRRPARHYLGRVFATAASLVLGLRVYDTQCGAKIFRGSDALRAALARPFRSRWIFDVELLARLSDQYESLGLPPLESAAYELTLREWSDIAGSKVGAGDFTVAAADLARIWLSRRGVHARAGAPERRAVRPEDAPDPGPRGDGAERGASSGLSGT